MNTRNFIVDKYTRKSFLKTLGKTTGSLFLLELLGSMGNLYSQNKSSFPLPDGEAPISETEPTANAMGFHHDATKTDFNLYPDRKKASSKNEVCKTCAQYTKLNDGWGKCVILNKGVVNANGWCSAWSKK